MAHWYRGVLHPWKVCMGVGWFLGDLQRYRVVSFVVCGGSRSRQGWDVLLVRENEICELGCCGGGGRDIITR